MSKMLIARLAGLVGLAVLLGGQLPIHAASPETRGGSSAAAAQAPEPPSRALFDRYCITCHNERLQTAGLMLDRLDVADVHGNAETLEKVVRKLRSGQMPPEGRPRPDAATIDAFAGALEAALDHAATLDPNPGRVASRRLNRLEYVNAVRDLLDLEIDGEALLPSDMAGFGFDNNADVLSITPALMSRYIAAATRISRVAVGSPDNRPVMQVYKVGYERRDVRRNEDMPFATHGGLAVRHTFPLDGEYLFAIRLKRNETIETIDGIAEDEHQIELRIDHALVRRFDIGGRFPGPDPGMLIAVPEDDVEGQRLHEYRMTADHELEIRVQVNAGTRLVSAGFTDSAPSPKRARRPAGHRHALHFGPVQRDRSGRHAEPAAHLHLPPGRRQHGGGGGLRPRDYRRAGPARLPAAGDRRRRRPVAGRIPRGPGRPRLRGGHRALPRGAAVDAQLPPAGRAAAGRYAAGGHLPPDRPGAGLAALVLSLEEHPGRGAARPRGRRPAERSGRARRPGAAHAGGSPRHAVHERLRRAVAGGPQHPLAGSGRRAVRRLQRLAAHRDGARDGDVLREPGARGPSDPRAAAGGIHVPERATRPPLRGGRRLREPVPASCVERRPPARVAGPREPADGDVLRQPHLGGSARQVGAGDPAGVAAAAAAGQRAAAGGETTGATRRRCANAWSCTAAVRSVRAVTAGWTRSASRWRTSTRSAAGGRTTAGRR